MRYYGICRQKLGNENFSTLLNELSNWIIVDYGKNINIAQFSKILDININALIMISIAYAYPNKKDRIISELQISKSYLITNSIETFETKMDNYIKILAQELKKN